jgi:hypothetical protein
MIFRINGNVSINIIIRKHNIGVMIVPRRRMTRMGVVSNALPSGTQLVLRKDGSYGCR